MLNVDCLFSQLVDARELRGPHRSALRKMNWGPVGPVGRVVSDGKVGVVGLPGGNGGGIDGHPKRGIY